MTPNNGKSTNPIAGLPPVYGPSGQQPGQQPGQPGSLPSPIQEAPVGVTNVAEACGNKPILRNFLEHFGTNGKSWTEPMDGEEILADAAVRLLPLVLVSGVLYAWARDRREWINVNDREKLFAWLKKWLTVKWHGRQNDFVGPSEFVHLLKEAPHVPRFQMFSTAPHVPPLPEVLYLNEIDPGDPSELLKVADHFGLWETPEDRWIFIAAVLTLFWGGPPGKKPVFVIRSPDEQGSGKSTLLNFLIRCLGLGSDVDVAVQLSTTGEIGKLSELLGSRDSDNPIPKVINIDNLKISDVKVCSTKTESMITGSTAQAKTLYVGTKTVTNVFQWIISGNHIDLTEDFSQRCIELWIRRPKYSAAWEDRHAEIDYRKIAAAAVAVLNLEARELDFDDYRFPLWTRAILGRLHYFDPTVDVAAIVAKLQERIGDSSTISDEVEEVQLYLDKYVNEIFSTAKGSLQDARTEGRSAELRDFLMIRDGQIIFTSTALSEWLNGHWSNKKSNPNTKSAWTATSAKQWIKQALSRLEGVSLIRHQNKRMIGYSLDHARQRFGHEDHQAHHAQQPVPPSTVRFPG